MMENEKENEKKQSFICIFMAHLCLRRSNE